MVKYKQGDIFWKFSHIKKKKNEWWILGAQEKKDPYLMCCQIESICLFIIIFKYEMKEEYNVLLFFIYKLKKKAGNREKC